MYARQGVELKYNIPVSCLPSQLVPVNWFVQVHL